MKILFVCNQNQNRSKTAEHLFKNKFETKSAGLYSIKPIKKAEIEWADIIIVMEEEQREELSKRFPNSYLKKQILNLEIPDIYHFNQPELINLLNTKFESLLTAHQIVA